MTKDWKAECDKLKGEIKQLKEQLDYERRVREEREDRTESLRNTFKQLLLDVLAE